MAQDQAPQPVSIDRPGQYKLKGDVRFVDLSRDQDTGRYRIRFSQGPATVLDILVSEGTLGDLSRALVPLLNPPAEFPNQVHASMKAPPKRPKES
jgi:hypothetical protein